MRPDYIVGDFVINKSEFSISNEDYEITPTRFHALKQGIDISIGDFTLVSCGDLHVKFCHDARGRAHFNDAPMWRRNPLQYTRSARLPQHIKKTQPIKVNDNIIHLGGGAIITFGCDNFIHVALRDPRHKLNLVILEGGIVCAAIDTHHIKFEPSK
jgi:hypothetical protein